MFKNTTKKLKTCYREVNVNVQEKVMWFHTLKLWINLSFSFKYLKLNVKILYYGEINNKMNIKGMLCFPLIN